MAILNNLIVHGRSRFLNGINADSIHTDLIDANDGVFKTITTTTLDASTITTDMLKANNARVSQTLAVDGTISTNKWEAASIANIGGNFYISPTGKADSGTITVTKTSTATINGVSVGVYTLVVGGTFGVTSTSSTVWGANSKVIFTGSISYPKMTDTDLSTTGKKYPLGSCNGTMTQVSTGTGTLTGFTITGINSPALDIFFKEVGVTSVSSTACSGYEMQISVYQSYYSSALHPVGILLTSYGKEKKQYIDIYGGANTLGDSDSGFADPAVRIGQLDGLPNIVDGSTAEATKPTGWGIYTTNGFFKGKIVSNAGLIANFTINGSKLYSNGHSAFNTATTGIYIGDDYISFGSGGVTYFNTSGTGKVGPWTLSTTYFRNGNIANATNTTVSGVYLGTDGLNISNGTAATTSYITKSAVNIGNKLTWNGTTLSVTGAIIATSLSTGTKTSATAGNGTFIDNSGNIYSGNGSTNNFSVTSAGVLTATNAVLKTVSLQDSSGNTRAVVDGNGLTIKDTSGNIASVFGAGTATIGYTSGDKYNIDITGTAIDLRYNTSILNRINSSGMTLYDGNGIAESNQIASFGETVTIGKQDAAQLKMDSGSIEGIGMNELSYFKIDNTGAVDTVRSYSYKKNYGPYSVTSSSSRTVNIKTTMDLLTAGSPFAIGGYRTDSGTWEGAKTKYTQRLDFIKGTSQTQSFTSSGLNIFSVQYDGANTITITSTSSSTRYIYITTWEIIEKTVYTPAYLFGYQNSSDLSYGKYAFVIGSDNVASGDYSHAGGVDTVASGFASYAEGRNTKAIGDYSHAKGRDTEAIGDYSHAEGNQTESSGSAAHAEGWGTRAIGDYSHSQNFGTRAVKQAQTVIGTFNEEDASTTTTHKSGDVDYGTYALIIGNGTATGVDRSNALTVDWSGNVTLKNHSSPIGSIISVIGGTDYTTNLTSGTSTWKQIASITLPPGIWIVRALARHDPSSSGARYSTINLSETPAQSAAHDRRYNTGTSETQHCFVAFFDYSDRTDNSTLYLNGHASAAGSWVRTNAAALNIRALRIV